jgi:hypothetical protein
MGNMGDATQRSDRDRRAICPLTLHFIYRQFYNGRGQL